MRVGLLLSMSSSSTTLTVALSIPLFYSLILLTILYTPECLLWLRYSNNTPFKRTAYSDLAWDDLVTLQVQVDKENSIEFPLDYVHYLYNYYMVCALLSHTHHVTSSCDVTLVTSWHMTMMCDICHVTLSHTPFLYSKSK